MRLSALNMMKDSKRLISFEVRADEFGGSPLKKSSRNVVDSGL
jgi:hypothetical protein